MENFKQIDKCNVWSHLQADKKVYAVIFKSKTWRTGLKELWRETWNVRDINKLLSDKEKDIIFFEEIEVKKMAKKYPEYLREEAVKQYLAGKRAEELAADVGCSQSTIYKWVNKHWKERDTHGKEV